MSIEGVWTGEFYGPYGWQNSGVYVLQNGFIVGGNDRHYSSGRYSISGDTYKAEVNVQYYGLPRAIFGEKREQFKIEVEGKLDGGTIVAEIVRPGRPQFALDYRMTRREDLPAA